MLWLKWVLRKVRQAWSSISCVLWLVGTMYGEPGVVEYFVGVVACGYYVR